MLLLKPDNKNSYILCLIGKKHLPEETGESYFTFIEKIFDNYFQLRKDFEEKEYQTKTKGKRHLGRAKCIGYGRYIIFFHNEHTSLAYKIILPEKIEKIQLEFNLKKKDTFIIQVKNTNSNPQMNLASDGPHFPKNLEKLFKGKKFIPLSSAEFLAYEGTEMLMISSGHKIPSPYDKYLEESSEKASKIFQEFI